MKETQGMGVRSLGQEDSLDSSILAWEIPGTKERGGL